MAKANLQEIELPAMLEGMPLLGKTRVDLSTRLLKFASPSDRADEQLVSEIKIPLRLNFFCSTCHGERSFVFREAPDRFYHLGLATTPTLVLISHITDTYVLPYVCVNCANSEKTLIVKYSLDDELSFLHKISEFPPNGPPIPKRLLKLVGDDKALLLQGYQAERQGFGIGAYGYYRRVVDEHKKQFLEEALKVAKLNNAEVTTIETIQNAIDARDFSASVSMVKDAIPKELFIDGQNPFTLLYGLLSEGLHSHTDAECLELAESIRVVLLAFCEKSETMLKEDEKLKKAVRLFNSRKSGQTKPSPEE